MTFKVLSCVEINSLWVKMLAMSKGSFILAELNSWKV